jgi:O-antigen ligase
MRAASHALVALMILVSGTGGAMLGYLCGLCACVLRARSGRYRVAAAVTVVLLAALAATVLSGQGVGDAGQMRLLGPVCTKIRIVQENFADLAAGEELNFWNLGEEHGGEELTSALWRLSHWHDMVRVYAASGWPVRLLGHGLGSSAALVDNLPHNDYLRLLFEIGALGLLANLAVWFILYRRANPASRWIAVTMAVYAFTENNLDNFLVMGLFALFMVGAGGVQAAEPMRPPRSEETAAEATA